MENRKRNNQVKIWLSDTEYKAFKERLERSKLQQGEFVRTSIKNVPIVVLEGFQDYLIELKKIGNNLNQLTRAVNSGQIDCKKEVEELTEEINKLSDVLKSLRTAEV